MLLLLGVLLLFLLLLLLGVLLLFLLLLLLGILLLLLLLLLLVVLLLFLLLLLLGVLLLLLLLLLLGILLLLLLLLPLGVLCLLLLLLLLGVLLLLLLLLPLGVLLLLLLLLLLGVLLLFLLLLPLGVLLLLRCCCCWASCCCFALLPLVILLLLLLGILLLFLLLPLPGVLLLLLLSGRLLLLTGYGGLRRGIRLRRALEISANLGLNTPDPAHVDDTNRSARRGRALAQLLDLEPSGAGDRDSFERRLLPVERNRSRRRSPRATTGRLNTLAGGRGAREAVSALAPRTLSLRGAMAGAAKTWTRASSADGTGRAS